MSIAKGDAVALTRELVRIDSRNPTLVPGAPGEARVARMLRDVLVSWGLQADLIEAAPGRPNVVARRPGSAGGRSLMLNGHLDVVDVKGMSHEPWSGEIADGNLYGRGASDMKAGVAAMCAAVAHLDAPLAGDVVIAAVVDEEYASAGTRAVVAAGIRADAAIVTEPTRLAIMPAHKGFVWIDVTTRGRAAHGSRWDLGVDAIMHAGLLLAELDHRTAAYEERRHPLLGRGSLHASLIEGGTGMSTYPDRCLLRLERRTIPGDSGAGVRDEIEAACRRVRAAHLDFHADVQVVLEQQPSDVSVNAPIVQQLDASLREEGVPVTTAGMSAWTDAALLNEAGIPAICFGPGDMSLAHADAEYASVREIEQATRVLTRLIHSWCTT